MDLDRIIQLATELKFHRDEATRIEGEIYEMLGKKPAKNGKPAEKKREKKPLVIAPKAKAKRGKKPKAGSAEAFAQRLENEPAFASEMKAAVLEALAHGPTDGSTTTDIRKETNKNHNAVAASLDVLEKEGLVAAERFRTGKRERVTYHLTAKGKFARKEGTAE